VPAVTLLVCHQRHLAVLCVVFGQAGGWGEGGQQCPAACGSGMG